VEVRETGWWLWVLGGRELNWSRETERERERKKKELIFIFIFLTLTVCYLRAQMSFSMI
jgi:hypothetical protein